MLRLVGPASKRPQVVSQGKRKLAAAFAGGLGNALALAEELGAEAMRDLLGSLFQLSLSQVEAADGRVIHFLDDSFFALFGLSDSGADPALEAVRVAVELQYLWSESLRERRVMDAAAHLRLGLHTGMITERKIGADQHDVYMPVGDTIYLARALQHYAEPGTVLVSETTYRRVQDEAYGAFAGLMPVEDKATSVVTYRIFGLHNVVRPRPYLMPSAPQAAN